MRADTTRPLASAFTQVLSEVAYLLQTEIRLAKTEMSEKLSEGANALTLVGIGAVLVLPGLFVLAMAAVRWLEVAGLPSEWGLLLVGSIIALSGALLAIKGANRLKGSALVPQRTLEQVRADLTVAREQMK